MKKLSIVLTSICGLVFLLSAYTKLFPVELFEYTIVNTGLVGWKTSLYLSRIIIAIEFFLGIMLLLNSRHNKIYIQAAILLLISFTCYLTVQLFVHGDTGNCGCFGAFLHMTPLQGIIKNFIMIALLLPSWKYDTSYPFHIPKLVQGAMLCCILALPFILNPVEIGLIDNYRSESLNYHFNFDLLYHSKKNKAPQVDLKHGKKIIAFLSLTCPHCRVAALKLHVIHKRNGEIPMFMILNGDSADLAPFFSVTLSQDVPHMMFLGMDFLKMSGPHLPSILWLDNGKVVKKSNYMLLKQEEMEAWLYDRNTNPIRTLIND